MVVDVVPRLIDRLAEIGRASWLPRRSSMMKRPLMPRCMTSTSPPSISDQDDIWPGETASFDRAVPFKRSAKAQAEKRKPQVGAAQIDLA